MMLTLNHGVYLGQITNMCFLLFIFFVVYAAAGVELFGRTSPHYPITISFPTVTQSINCIPANLACQT